MAKPYSYDFRQKVIQAIELDGLKKREASELFNISRNTINLWLQRKAETGDVQALPNRPPVITTKSQTGSSFGRLPRLMEIKPRWRWRNCGRVTSAIAYGRAALNAQSHGL
jgi:transposase-like protein